MEDSMIVNILYKNGVEKEYRFPVTVENYHDMQEVQTTIKNSFRKGIDGCITLGDAEKYGVYIRLSEAVEIKFTAVEENE